MFVLKANESVKNYTSERRMYANYVARNIKNICKTVGPRCAGTDKELEAQKWMAQELETTCDEVNIESFKLHPRAFMGWIQLTVFCVTVAAVMLFLTHFVPAAATALLAAGVALIVIALFFIVTEFLMYKETLDPFTKQSMSHNVVAVRKASGETKKRIIVSGHADSAMEWRFTYWGGPKLIVPVIGISLVGVLFTAVADIIALVFVIGGTAPADSKAIWVLSIISVCFVPLFLFCLLFYDPKRIVEGANDNLTGCLTSMAVTRFMQDHDIRFENTEVWVVCTGAEEAGLRGAKAFCKAHAGQFKQEKDVETVFLGFDTIRDFDFMAIYNKDMTGFVSNDADASKLLKAGAEIAGYDIPFKTVSLGATDAAAFTQAGIKASSFAAMDPAPARYYHTRLDTHENLDLKTIEAAVDICLETVFLFDEKGLNV